MVAVATRKVVVLVETPWAVYPVRLVPVWQTPSPARLLRMRLAQFLVRLLEQQTRATEAVLVFREPEVREWLL